MAVGFKQVAGLCIWVPCILVGTNEKIIAGSAISVAPVSLAKGSHGGGWLSCLQISSFNRRHATFVAHENMIHYLDADPIESVFEGCGHSIPTLTLMQLTQCHGVLEMMLPRGEAKLGVRLSRRHQKVADWSAWSFPQHDSRVSWLPSAQRHGNGGEGAAPVTGQ